MLRLTTFTVLVSVIICSAQIPQTLQYQGKLTSATGIGITDTLPMRFVIYNAATGGDSLWGEVHDGTSAVPVNKGLFSVKLGSINPINLPFDEQYWLGIFVDGSAVNPRVELTASPYSFRALVADSIAGSTPQDTFIAYWDSIRNVPAEIYDRGFIQLRTAGEPWLTDSATFAAGENITLTQSNDTIYISSDDAQWTLSGGALYPRSTAYNVGIGTATPFQKLDVQGGIRVGYTDIPIVGSIRFNADHFEGYVPDSGWITLSGGRVVYDTSLHWSQSGNSLYLTDPTNNVGIGTNTPSTKLHIVGDLRTDGNFYLNGALNDGGGFGNPGQILSSTGSGVQWIDYTPAVNDSDWQVSGTDMYALPSGNVGIGTTTPSAKLEVSGEAIFGGQVRVYGATRLILSDTIASKSIALRTDGAAVDVEADSADLYINGDSNIYLNPESPGNIGIGMTTPESRLDVAGDVRVRGGIRVDGMFIDNYGNLPGPNQYLTLDSLGNLAWEDVEFGAIGINDLIDVDTAGVEDGQVLKWVAVAGEWRPANDVGGETGADNWGTQVVLTDSSLVGDGTSAEHLGINWDTLDAHISRTINLGDLNNVDDTGVSDGQLLTWVAAANQWRPMALDSGGLGGGMGPLGVAWRGD